MGAFLALESFDDKIDASQCALIVEAAFVGSLGQLDQLVRHFLVRDRLQQVRDAVEAGAPFIVRMYDIPWRMLRVR